MSRLQTKALKAALLAISASSIGSHDEADAAGRRAGELWRRSGGGLLCLYLALAPHGVRDAESAWRSVVDSWFRTRVAA